MGVSLAPFDYIESQFTTDQLTPQQLLLEVDNLEISHTLNAHQ